jgi:hypothetical protein
VADKKTKRCGLKGSKDYQNPFSYKFSYESNFDLLLLFGLENREYGRGDPLSWSHGTLYPQKLALTSLTSVGRSAQFAHGLRPRSLFFLFPDIGTVPHFQRIFWLPLSCLCSVLWLWDSNIYLVFCVFTSRPTSFLASFSFSFHQHGKAVAMPNLISVPLGFLGHS